MKAKEWYAWINVQPPPPDDFHVVGEILVNNPGLQAQLCVKEPQGSNPTTILLDLYLFQRPGDWPQVMAWVEARYDKILIPSNPKYEQVEIFLDNERIAQVPVEEIH